MTALRRAGSGPGAVLATATLLVCLWLPPAPARDAAAAAAGPTESVARLDRALIEARLRQMPPPVAGRPDLSAIAFAGDGAEHVFRNEVLYFEQLASARCGVAGRALALVNHPHRLGDDPRPLATPENLRLALQGVGRLMDPREDLLLFPTSHCSPDHALNARPGGHAVAELQPREMREALDAAGIRNRLPIVSACYSGGFIRPSPTQPRS